MGGGLVVCMVRGEGRFMVDLLETRGRKQDFEDRGFEAGYTLFLCMSWLIMGWWSLDSFSAAE
jgi:hypothetical protein